MSWQPAQEPRASGGSGAGLDVVIIPRVRDLGGFEVRRVLPAGERRTVGPFIFFDQMGPITFKAGTGIDVRPHPHIGLATITYLFEGEILHRDSLGNAQAIRPGEVNWMTAGRGIVHSERTPEALRMAPSPVFGIQAWVALPRAQEEMEPSFAHHAAETLPIIEGKGSRVRLMIGSLMGARSPVATVSEMVYADATLGAGARLAFPVEHEERAIYVVKGVIDIASRSFGASQLLVLKRGVEAAVVAPQGARLLLLGGAAMDGVRHIWWNFVSSSQQRIDQAKADWKAGRFPSVPGETEFIPLPE
ncbi:MAG TPA: pirin family protein [Stellaceae bacterium]|jgi:redox-sensitive bicupin YhaK (pirin superfamily)|nr:pirin family protein [Stellaceae bacterium]